MKALFKLIIGLLIPNLFLTYAISSNLKKGEDNTDINTKEDINFLYFMTALIVIVPISLYAYFYFAEINTDNNFLLNYFKFGASNSFFFGILFSFIYLSFSAESKFNKK